MTSITIGPAGGLVHQIALEVIRGCRGRVVIIDLIEAFGHASFGDRGKDIDIAIRGGRQATHEYLTESLRAAAESEYPDIIIYGFQVAWPELDIQQRASLAKQIADFGTTHVGIFWSRSRHCEPDADLIDFVRSASAF